MDYDWPGNVRELENCMERAVALCRLDEMERRYVRQVLSAVNGNKTHAARILGIDRRSLYRRLEEPKDKAAAPAPSAAHPEHRAPAAPPHANGSNGNGSSTAHPGEPEHV